MSAANNKNKNDNKKYDYTGKWINVVLRKKTHDDLEILGGRQSFDETIQTLLVPKADVIKAIREQRQLLAVTR
jgi:hypothetical protein